MPIPSEARDAWGRYRQALLNAYTDDGLLRDDPDSLLPELAEAAEDLAGELVGRLQFVLPSSTDPHDIEAALTATAAVDTAVAADIFERQLRSEGVDLGVVEIPADILSSLPPSGDRESMFTLIGQADEAFGEGLGAGGAQYVEGPVVPRSFAAIDEILESCTPVAAAFGKGVLNAGAGTMVAAVTSGVGQLDALARVANSKAGLGSRFLRVAVRKLIDLAVSDPAREIGADLLLDHFEESFLAVSGRAEMASRWVIRRVVREGRARARVVSVSERFNPAEAEDLDTALTDLCRRYDKLMRSAASVQRNLRRVGPLVIVAGAVVTAGFPAGAAVLASANAIGMIFCLHSAADRLDTVPGWVSGVVEILEGRCFPPPRTYSF